ncbi:MBL fold metallo-hydrolase [Rossellomorea aquimaris]|uniref:MBL fold metallo-hydrolase n=1 Tax=Rossellomorea aquimaris TaxID=189382 RepID=UPI001CD67822|nr:MBL fold metallo-hydrolase [Rossellomorea aquimaris]MCA1054083.1 MBL fold metallo-hydrolase [Rossellomorea aquimaris]
MTIDTPFFSLHRLCDGVYASIAKPGQGAWSNAGIVDLGEELLVFDSHSTPSAGIKLRRQAEEMTGKTVKYLANSHYHGDHVFGNQAFQNATIISTPLTRELSEEHNKIGDLEQEDLDMQQYLLALKNQIPRTKESIRKESLLNQYHEMTNVYEDLRSLKQTLATVLFDKKLVIRGSERIVELHCLGGGHTPSDTFMYLPQDGIVFMGDLLTEKLHVPIHNPEAFLSILKEVRTMPVHTLVPGHGNVGGMGMIDDLADYLLMIMQSVQGAQRRNQSLDELIAEFIAPDIYKEWKGVKGIDANLSSVYDFLSKEENT